jgi:hypothetical protein
VSQCLLSPNIIQVLNSNALHHDLYQHADRDASTFMQCDEYKHCSVLQGEDVIRRILDKIEATRADD